MALAVAVINSGAARRPGAPGGRGQRRPGELETESAN